MMKVVKIHGQGNHLIVDGQSFAEIDSVNFIKEFIVGLVRKLGMRAISEPLVLYHKAEYDLESGVTGTIILAESNVTIHTYPYKKFFCLDVFSCKEFEIEKVMDYLIKKLKLGKYTKRVLKRGDY